MRCRPQFVPKTMLAVPILSLFFVEMAGRAGQIVAPDSAVTRSVSGLFMIHDQRRSGPSQLADLLLTNSQFAAFDPTVLAVSCERVKNDLRKQLGLTASSRDKVHIALHTASAPDETISIVRQRFSDSWQYRVDLPDAADRVRYVRAMVEVVLLEFANRSAGTRSAEIPSWLIDGLTQQLLSSEAMEVIVPPPRRSVNGVVLTSTIRNERRQDPLEYARVQLRAHPMLTFAALSWPGEQAWSAESDEFYRLNSQLFVNELLGLENGALHLRQLLSLLAERYN